MAKVLKFKEVNSDVESRMKDFEKMRLKLKAEIKKAEAKKISTRKEEKSFLKSISGFFADSPKTPTKTNAKK